MKKDLGILILLVALCAIAYFMNDRFLTAYNLQNNARLIGMYGIFSIGLGIVIITGGIDLSVGSAFALQGILLAALLRGGTLNLLPATLFFPEASIKIPAMHWGLAILITLALMCTLGLIHALLI